MRDSSSFLTPALRQEIADAESRRRAAGRQAARTRSRALTASKATGQPLRKWQVLYAQWLAGEPTRPTYKEKKNRIASLAKVPADKVSTAFVKKLEDRADFDELVSQFEESILAQARAHVECATVTGAELYGASLEEAKLLLAQHRAEGADSDLDVMSFLRLIPTLTQPAVDRAMPKHTEHSGAAVNVQINLTPQQAALLDDSLPTVDYEVVDPA